MSFFYKHLLNFLKYSREIFQVPNVSLRVPNLENKKVAHVWVFISLQKPPLYMPLWQHIKQLFFLKDHLKSQILRSTN